MSLLMQQRSLIQYFVLCRKSSQQIAGKLAKGDGQDALCLRAVQKWAARFRAGQEDVKDDQRSRRPPQKDIYNIILSFLEKNPHSSSRDISNALLTRKMIILRLLADLGLKSHQARWIPHRLSEQYKAHRMTLSQDMRQDDEGPWTSQQQYVITGDESWIF
jgi:hypothetical protein